MCTVHEQLQTDLKEFDSKVLHLTKKLDDANAAQKVTFKALEVTNEEKRLLREKSTFYRLEAEGLRGSLEASEKGRKEVEVEIARLLGEKKEMDRKLESVEAEYDANFHNTEAYTNFSDNFAKIAHQEVLAMLRSEHPNFNIGSLEDRFHPSDVGGEEDI
ncbi:hypothetical protein Adt_31473 [Abeliophyllum distichum]|uniref:Uncharacterized protein n=1 Tax=Abeliophyllum distichum TaxID=126358 RepID=A0ABD1RE83_9LAMI